MNNENNNLNQMYGNEPTNPVVPVTNPVIQPAAPVTPVVTEPQNNMMSGPMMTEIDPNTQNQQAAQNNNQPNKKKGSPVAVILLLLLIIGGVVGYLVYSGKIDLFNNGNNDNQTETKKDKDTTPKVDQNEEWVKVIKGYTIKIEDFVQSNKYECPNTNLNPTRFCIEIDTTKGDSVAQKNANMLGITNTKSPWQNDIKGYIIVERQLRAGSIYYVNLSDSNYGLSQEIETSQLTKDSIVTGIAYPQTPADYIKCSLVKKDAAQPAQPSEPASQNNNDDDDDDFEEEPEYDIELDNE